MLVPVCDRQSVAEPTEAQDRAVMETKSATIHRKMPMPARQLPITGFAHKTAVVFDDRVRTAFAPRHMPAKRNCAAALDRAHDLHLVEADMAGVGAPPRRAMVAENVRNLQSGTGHGRGPFKPAAAPCFSFWTS